MGSGAVFDAVFHTIKNRDELWFSSALLLYPALQTLSSFMQYSTRTPPTMSRGNQREIDRARAAKRKEGQGVKAKDKDGLTAAQRRERDAQALQEKAARKAAEGAK